MQTYMLLDINGKVLGAAYEQDFQTAIEVFSLMFDNVAKSHIAEFVLTDFDVMRVHCWKQETALAMSQEGVL